MTMSDRPIYTSRREFLAGSLTLLSTAGTLPVFLGRAAEALAGPRSGKPKRSDSHRILVVVQLAGGNDGLNTVIPFGQDAYYRARRRLAIAKKDVLRIADGIGLHPAAAGLKELFDAGQMAIVQGVGYPNPNRSHFTSTDIWQCADPRLRSHEGWLGRYFDAQRGKGKRVPEPIEAIALTREAPFALQGARFAPLAFENAKTLTWQVGARDEAAAALFRRLNNESGDLPPAHNPTEEFVQRAGLTALLGADEIRAAAGGRSRGGGGRRGRRGRGGRGGALGRSLETVANMIEADLPTRVYYVSMGGFDTHTNQLGRHQNLMRDLGDAMWAFLDRLRAADLLDRVLVMTFSEFGRRVEENASGGTDHGEAQPMFLFGGRLKPGLHMRHPDLRKLHRGDLAFGCDFRRVYAAVLRDWLKIKPSLVLKGNFAPLKIIRG